MPIPVSCPCGYRTQVKDHLAGYKTQCRKCRAVFRVPGKKIPVVTPIELPVSSTTNLSKPPELEPLILEVEPELVVLECLPVETEPELVLLPLAEEEELLVLEAIVDEPELSVPHPKPGSSNDSEIRLAPW
jgi:hypothetical protein